MALQFLHWRFTGGASLSWAGTSRHADRRSGPPEGGRHCIRSFALSAMTDKKCASRRCRSVRCKKNMKAGDRHKPSINARIFMVRAPRERPMACAGSPLFRLRHSDAALPPSNRSAPAFGLPAEAGRGISVQTLMAAQRMKSLWSVLRGPKTGPSRSARKHRSSCRNPSWKS